MRVDRDRLVGLCLPPVAFAALDGGLTLAGQSTVYWSGEYRSVNEASPTFHHLLAIHPLAFVAGIAVWVAVFCGFILLVSETWALVASLTVTNGHAAGAATWLLWRFQYGYQAANGLFLLAAIAAGVGIRHGWRARPEGSVATPRVASTWNRVLAALLFAFAIWLFVWPRTS